MKKLTLILSICAFTAHAQVETFYPSKDVSLGYHDNYNTANTNYGSAAQFAGFVIVGVQGGFNKNRGLIAFDLSSIPAGTTVVSAKLNLFAFNEYNSATTISQGHIGNNASHLRMCTSPWAESVITWNTQPTTTNVNQVILPQSTSLHQNYIVDVTAMTQYFVNNPTLNYGWLLGLEDETLNNNLSFYSRETSDMTKKPRLEIEIRSTAAVQEIETNQINIFPNPSKENVMISCENPIQTIQVFDAQGKIVFEALPSKELTYNLDVVDFEKGIYILKIQHGNGITSTGRFIKN